MRTEAEHGPQSSSWSIASALLAIGSLVFLIVAHWFVERLAALPPIGESTGAVPTSGSLHTASIPSEVQQAEATAPIAGEKKPESRILLNPLYDANELASIASSNAVRVRFAGLYKKLGLSAKQIEAFERALSEGEPSIRTLETAERILKHIGGSQELAIVNETTKSLAERIESMVGRDAADEFKRVIYTADIQEIVDQVILSQRYASQPITPKIAEQLLDAALSAAGASQPSGRVRTSDLRWDHFRRSAEGFLPEEVLASIDAIRAKREVEEQYTKISGFRAPAELLGL